MVSCWLAGWLVGKLVPWKWIGTITAVKKQCGFRKNMISALRGTRHEPVESLNHFVLILCIFDVFYRLLESSREAGEGIPGLNLPPYTPPAYSFEVKWCMNELSNNKMRTILSDSHLLGKIISDINDWMSFARDFRLPVRPFLLSIFV